MKSPTGFCAALLGSGFWFVTGIVVAAIPYHAATSNDIPPAQPAQDSSAFTTEDRSTAPVLDEYTASCACCRWQVWANALFLTRSSTSNQTLVYKGKTTEEIFGSQDLHFGFAWGPNVGLAYCLDRCNSIGVEYYGIDDWTSTGQVAGDVSVQFPLSGGSTNGGVATFRYTSNLHNTEINLRHRSSNAGWLTTLAGFRWIEISEQFGSVFTETSPAATQNYSIDVSNHLYGFQVGVVANIQNSGPWFFDAWLKEGVFGNSASQSTMEDFRSAGGGMVFAAAGGSNVAFVGDVGLSVGRRITDRLSARLSYMVLWIDGVALAPEQMEVSSPGIGGLNNSGGVLYHGGFAGVEYCW
jgi:hypothetical protein